MQDHAFARGIRITMTMQPIHQQYRTGKRMHGSCTQQSSTAATSDSCPYHAEQQPLLLLMLLLLLLLLGAVSMSLTCSMRGLLAALPQFAACGPAACCRCPLPPSSALCSCAHTCVICRLSWFPRMSVMRSGYRTCGFQQVAVTQRHNTQTGVKTRSGSSAGCPAKQQLLLL
jgi:hypothetical protein